MNTWVQVLGWLVVFAAPIVGWALAAVAVGEPARWGRGALAVGRAALITLGLVIALRVVELFSVPMAGGPLGWLTDSAAVATAWTPGEAVLLMAVGLALLFPWISLALGRWQRGRAIKRPFRVPLSGGVGLFLAAAAPLSVIAGYGPFSQTGQAVVLLDLAASLPLVCVALAVWTRGRFIPTRPADEELPAPEAPRQRAALDVPKIWRQAQALEADAQPLFVHHGRVEDDPGGPADEVWRVVGCPGPAPQALEELWKRSAEPGQGWIVGDLPDPTEERFLTVLLLMVLREHGLRCVVVTPEPARRRDALLEALEAAGTWSLGRLVAGAQELRDTLARRIVPAVVFLDVPELSAEGIRAMSARRDKTGTVWCSAVDLVVISGIDRGQPLDVTHRMFTLRRLGLALLSGGAQWSALATGFGGAGSRHLLEQVFPSIPASEVPFGARATAHIQAWEVSGRFRAQPGDAWARRAIEPLARQGYPVAVGDPMGAFDRRSVEVWGGQVRLVRDVTLDGQASVADLNDAWLVASFRALANRIPTSDGSTHHALWSLDDNPVTHFLRRDGNLRGLYESGRLVSPRPLVGYDNHALAKAHLLAALREGHQDEESLAGLFGRSLVELVLKTGYTRGGHVVRALPRGGRLTRVPLVVPDSDERVEPLRGTVTGNVVRIVDNHGGRLLAEVDRLVAETRYYPRRVFAIREQRYEVPLHAFDPKRGEICVELAPERSLTQPILELAASNPRLIEAPQEHFRGELHFVVASFDVTVHEVVSGVELPGEDVMNYAPVRCRYRTRARGIFFPTPSSPSARFHLARSLDDVLVSQLLARDEDLEVIPVEAGFWEGLPAGILAIDRHIQGMGAAEALDHDVVTNGLNWVHAILSRCKCPDGCRRCTPRRVCEVGPDKSGVLQLLGVE